MGRVGSGVGQCWVVYGGKDGVRVHVGNVDVGDVRDIVDRTVGALGSVERVGRVRRGM